MDYGLRVIHLGFTSIALDSNIFRNQDFINYLTLHAVDFKIFLPSIVQLEVGYFYRVKNISWPQLKADLNKFGCKLVPWGNFKNSNVIENAYKNRNELPFHHHFRDYLIGTECKNTVKMLITYNKKHFLWLNKVQILTPEELVVYHQEILQRQKSE